MTPASRVDELRRRVTADPTSIAFAALAEEYRKLGQFAEAIEVCRAGLVRHPTYHSARVTLARSLSEVNERGAAAAEFALVIQAAPQNLLARKGLADVLRRQGDLLGALEHLRYAAMLAPQDPEIRESIWTLERGLAGSRPEPPARSGAPPPMRVVEPPQPTPVVRLHPVAVEPPASDAWPPSSDDVSVQAHEQPPAVAPVSEARSQKDDLSRRQLEALQDLLALIEQTKLGRSVSRS